MRCRTAGALALASAFFLLSAMYSHGQSCSSSTPCIIAPPSGMQPGNLYMSGIQPYSGKDSGIAASKVATIGFTSSASNSYPIPSTARTVEVLPGATPGTWYLPAASSVPAGQAIQIVDPNGNISGTNSLAFLPAAGTSDTINGQPANTPGVLPPSGPDW